MRQPRRGGQPLPRPRGRSTPGPAGSPASSTRRRWSTAPTSCSTTSRSRSRACARRWARCPAASASRSPSRARCSGEPKLVMLDEPTAALGVPQTKQVLALIKRLKERGLGVVVISHNLADVFEVCDRVFVLRLGKAAGDFKVSETDRAGDRRAPSPAREAPDGGGAGMSAAARHHGHARRRAAHRPAVRAPLRGGRPRLAASGPRPGGDLDHLPVPERPLPVRGQPHQPDAADHGRRPDLGRDRLRAAAWRDRPVRRGGERPCGGGGRRPERQARVEPLPGDRRRGARPAR